MIFRSNAAQAPGVPGLAGVMSIVVTKNGQESSHSRAASVVVSQATREMSRGGGGTAADAAAQVQRELKTVGEEIDAIDARRKQIHTRLTFIRENSKSIIGVDKTRYITERSSLIAELDNLEKRNKKLKEQRATLSNRTSVHGPISDKGNMLFALCDDVSAMKKDLAEVLALLKQGAAR